MNPPIWTPSAERAAGTNLARFARKHAPADVADYDALWRWSVEQPERFWSAVWEFCKVRASRRADRVLTDADRMPGARWFEGAQLNFAEHLLEGALRRAPAGKPVLVALDERGRRRALARAEWFAQVDKPLELDDIVSA